MMGFHHQYLLVCVPGARNDGFGMTTNGMSGEQEFWNEHLCFHLSSGGRRSTSMIAEIG